MNVDDLDFDLPPDLIAQVPAEPREASRLLHYRRADGAVADRAFSELPGLLRAGDLLVFNDSRVIPARFLLLKPTGGQVDGLFLAEPEPGKWDVLLRDPGPADRLTFAAAPHVHARIIERGRDGQCRIAVDAGQPALDFLQQVGRMPLPPYIKRRRGTDDRDPLDRNRYQTVYARDAGSVAAPTAGLHFSQAILDDLAARGIQRTFVTLHVGLGTFKPVTAERLEDHMMHAESYTISPAAADALNAARRDHRRIIAVGTTAARVLESQPAEAPFAPISAQTALLIHPPYQWKHVDALITNFHLPRSTLIALVAALMGLEEQRRIYRTAIEHRYRFFSYGDAMLIE